MRRFETEEHAMTALQLAGYQQDGAAWIKDGQRVKIKRDSWKADYYIDAARNVRC